MNIHSHLFSLVGFIYSFFTLNVVFSSTPIRNGSTPTEITLDGRRYVIHEGDILMDADVFELMKENLTVYGNVATDPRVRWPTRNIPYTIEPYVYTQYEVQVIHAGVKFLQEYTCLTFEYVNPRDARFKIYVSKTAQGGGCYSSIGYQKQVLLDVGRYPGDYQTVSLGPECITEQTVEHEFMHALGLGHEQSRPDRDKYVNIYWGNVVQREDIISNFFVFNPSTTYNLPYDYGSGMHYPTHAFSGNGRPTIEAKDNRICLGNLIRATDCDILKVNLLYGCERIGGRTCTPFIQYRNLYGECPR